MKQAAGALRRGVVASMAMAGLLGPALGQDRASLPVIDRIRHGDVTVPDVSAGDRAMTITQTGRVAKIDWKSFDIAKDHAVRIVQPKDAVLVNRVVGGAWSGIDGALNADGTVFLINESGIVLGQHARISAGGWVAAAARLDDAAMETDAVATTLQHGAGTSGRVSLRGAVTVREGGVLTLAAGDAVQQEGQAIAPRGTVSLTSARRITLDEAGRTTHAEGGFGSLTHGGHTAAPDGVVRMVGGTRHGRATPQSAAKLTVGGTIDLGTQGRLAVRSQGRAMHWVGDVQGGRGIEFLDTLDRIADRSAPGELPAHTLVDWLNAGIDVVLTPDERLRVDAAISTSPDAAGSLTLGTADVNAPVTLGRGTLTLKSVAQRPAAIGTRAGAVVIEAHSYTHLGHVETPQLEVHAPVRLRLRPRDKVYDGTQKASAGAAIDRIWLSADSNLRFERRHTFASKDVGERAISTTVDLVGFHGDARVPLQVDDGRGHARILPRSVDAHAVAASKAFDGSEEAEVTLSSPDLMAGDHVDLKHRSASFDSSAPGARRVTMSGLWLDGEDAGNYQLSSTETVIDGVIEAQAPMAPPESGPGDGAGANAGAKPVAPEPEQKPDGDAATRGREGFGITVPAVDTEPPIVPPPTAERGPSTEEKIPGANGRPGVSTTRLPFAARSAIACEQRRSVAPSVNCDDAFIEPPGPAASAARWRGIRLPAGGSASRPQR